MRYADPSKCLRDLSSSLVTSRLVRGATCALVLSGVCLASATVAQAGPRAFSTELSAHATTGRYRAMGAPLPGGKVLIVGGLNEIYSGQSLASAEVFDSATRTFTALEGPGSELPVGVEIGVAAPLPGGDVLIAGGNSRGSGLLNKATIFDSSTDQFTALGSGHEMQTARYEAVAAPLPDGDVLIAGGLTGGSSTVASAELFDPSTKTFTTLTNSGGQMTTPRREAVASALPDGDVLIAGGRESSGPFLTSAELFDPSTDTFTALDPSHTHMVEPRSMPSAGPLSSGQVLITSGGSLDAESFDPESDTFYSLEASGGVLHESPEGGLMVPITGSNLAVVTGGQIGFNEFSSSAELLDVRPASAQVVGGEFGAQTVGQPSATQALVVSSAGVLPLSVNSATLGGADAEDFSVKADYCEGEILFFKQTCAISVGFTPSASGPRTALLTLHEGTNSTATIALSGTGLESESATKSTSGSIAPAVTTTGPAPATAPRPMAPSIGSKRCLQVSVELVGRSQPDSAQTIEACGIVRLPNASHVKLTRRGKVYASGGATGIGGASTLRLHRRRATTPGYYTLTLTSGHGWSAHVTRLVVKIV